MRLASEIDFAQANECSLGAEPPDAKRRGAKRYGGVDSQGE